MTATLTRPDATSGRSVELVLAHAHLRLGSLALARTELETLAGLGRLDTIGLVDLAEVRWRTGDLAGAGEAAAVALRGDEEHPVALLIAAEAAAALGRPSKSRRLAARAMANATGSIDAIFAGMPRSAAWPADADEPPPTAPTLFDRAPDAPGQAQLSDAAASASATAVQAAAPAAVVPAPGPMTLGLWDDDVPEAPGARDLPEPARELEAGRTALVAGKFDEAILRFGLALRLAPALAPAVLEATAGARASGLLMVRGDAYRLAGHEDEAKEAYLAAARGGLPERRRRSRIRQAKTEPAALADPQTPAATTTIGADDAASVADTEPETETVPEAEHRIAPEPGAEPAAVAEPEPAAEPAAHLEPATAADHEPAAHAEPEPAAEPAAHAEPEPAAEPESARPPADEGGGDDDADHVDPSAGTANDAPA